MLDHCALKDDETRCICEALQNNKKLKYLTLRENSLHPAEHVWCNMLQENSVLKTLALSNCYLSPEACFGLAQGLKSNKGLTSLCLNGCEVDDVGLLHLSDVLRVNSTLLSLRCYSRNCSNKGALSLAAAVSVNKVIESIMFPQSDEDAEEEVAAWLLLNGSLTDCSGKFLAICERNFEMHEKAKQAVQALRLLRWKEGEGDKTVFHALPKGIVKIIGVLVWESRTEVETWAHSL
jgi:Ran GTPase-activating protein (RanGAP) involved in mRNA processing and transport